MRLKRHKKFQRHINFYAKNFYFKTPYNILVDGTFAKAALDNKVNMKEQLPKYLDAQVKLVATPCTLIETEKLGPELYGALQVLKQLSVHKCTHADKPVPATKCILSMVHKSNSNEKILMNEETRYIVATQDYTLRLSIEEIPGIPLIHLYGSAPTLEKPSAVSEKLVQDKMLQKMEVMNYQKEILNQMKKTSLCEETGHGPERNKGTKKRKRVGPNPLSCKKSKKSKAPSASSTKESNVKKKRKRVRLAKHVKIELGIAT